MIVLAYVLVGMAMFFLVWLVVLTLAPLFRPRRRMRARERAIDEYLWTNEE